jgi:hypothetical protein
VGRQADNLADRRLKIEFAAANIGIQTDVHTEISASTDTSSALVV